MDITSTSWIEYGLGQSATPFACAKEKALSWYRFIISVIYSGQYDDVIVGELREGVLAQMNDEVRAEFDKLVQSG